MSTQPEDPNADVTARLPSDLSLADWTRLLRADLRRRWRQGELVRVEIYLEKHAAVRNSEEAVLDLIEEESRQREDRGEPIIEAEWRARFPHLAESIRRRFALHRAWAEGRFQPTEAMAAAPPTVPESSQGVEASKGVGEEPTVGAAPPPAPAPEAATLAPRPTPPEAEATKLDHLEAVEEEPVEVFPIAVAAARRVLPRVPGYEILAELGRGGMGVVYKARQVGFNRLVALKMLLSGAHAGAEERARFLREAEAVARLKHPGIVDVYAFGELDGCPYFSLEYVEGGNLADRLRGRAMPPRDAAALAAELARAADYAHQEGVVHRDLKPANVLLTADGRPKIADFGLAKEMEVEGQTQSGAVLGTPSYMAPEQAEGKSRRISPRTDVYALGAVLYEMLTGRPPFRAATTLDTLLMVLGEEAPAPRTINPGVPADLETICLKCLNKAPEHRYTDARRLAEDLECCVRGEAPRHARPPSGWRRRSEAAWRETNTPLWSLIVAVALVTAVTPFGGVHFVIFPIAATVTAAFLYTRAKLSSLALSGASLTSAVAVVVFAGFENQITTRWLDPPWGELALGIVLVGVIVPLLGLLLSKANRTLSLLLLGTAGLTAVGVILSEEPGGLVVGAAIGLTLGAVSRITAKIAKTPVGVALTGAFWGGMLNPCGCGPFGPIAFLFSMNGLGAQGDSAHGSQLLAALTTAIVYAPVYAIFAIIGAVVNVLIYRWRRRSLWERSGYASTLRRGDDDQTVAPDK